MPRPRPRVTLDTSALFAALLSASGGARQLLRLGEAGLIQLVVGPRVLAELDGVITRKAPDLRPTVAVLLDAAACETGPIASPTHLAVVSQVLAYGPDAQILADALAANSDYLVSLDREHLVGQPSLSLLPITIGTPGDCLAWLRAGGGPLDEVWAFPILESEAEYLMQPATIDR